MKIEDIPSDYLEWAINTFKRAPKAAVYLSECRRILQERMFKEVPGKPDILDTHNVVSGFEHAKLKARLSEVERNLVEEKAKSYHYKLAYEQAFREARALEFKLASKHFENMIFNIAGMPNNENGNAKRIYRDLALKYHPDRGGSKEAMQAVNEFYQALEKK